MTADRVGPLQGAIDGHTVTVVVVCRFIGCDWKMEIGTAPLEAHNAYLDHLDVHDVADCEAGEPDQLAAAEHAVHHQAPAEVGYSVEVNGGLYAGEDVDRSDEAIDELAAVCGLYAGDTAEQIAADQARVDRFMAGGEDR